MSNRTVFIDTSLSNYETPAAQYDASLFNIVYLTDPRTGYLQIQEYLTTNNISTADINVVSASSSLSGLFTGRVVFVDPSATDYQTLIAGMDAGATVVVLDANSDGVQQIHDYLANNAGLVSAVDIITGGGLSSLDVVSHGDAGALYLGSTVLTSDNMNQYTDLLADIGNQLTDNGDILLYGCDVAAGDIGQQFINQLADATGADVAASTDLTGATALGGDWVLEANTGSIETITLSDPDYNALLAALPAPSISSITDDALPSTGSLTDGSSTNDTTPTIRVNLSGTGAQAGDTVKLYDDTTSLGSAVSLTSLDISNAYKDITTAVLTNGAYNFRATWWNGSTERDLCKTPDFLKSGKKMAISIRFVWVF